MDFSVIILLSLVCIVDALDFRQRCLYYDKQCVPNCPRLMHPYHTRCDGKTMSQRTCDSPSTYVLGYTCGWSRCDCNGHLLLDEESGFCVTLENCPVHLSRRNKNRIRKKKPPHSLPKRFKPDDFADPMEKLIRDTV